LELKLSLTTLCYEQLQACFSSWQHENKKKKAAVKHENTRKRNSILSSIQLYHRKLDAKQSK